MILERHLDYRILMCFTVIGAAALAPLTVYHVISRNPLLIVLTGGLCGACVMAAAVIRWYPHNQWVVGSIGLVIVTLYNSVCIGVLVLLGGPGSYWVYCAILANFYILRLKHALGLNLALALSALWLLYGQMEPAYYYRFLATLPICMFFAVVFGSAITRQRDILRREVMVDSLTGARNRRSLGPNLEVAVERRERYGEPASLIMIDLDHFKGFNDAFGHIAGDEALKSVVGILLRDTRKMDSVYRYGGDEFLVLLPHADMQQAAGFAERFHANIHKTGIGPRDPGLTVSIGIAELSPDQSAEDWLHAADTALYEAKIAGRNTIRTTANSRGSASEGRSLEPG